jgi:hypothetical protein
MRSVLPLIACLPFAPAAIAMEFVDDLRFEIGGYAVTNTRDHRDITAGSDSAYLTTSSSDISTDNSYDRTSFAVSFTWGRLHEDGGLLVSAGFSYYDSYTDVTDTGIGQTFSLESDISEFCFSIGYGLPVTRWSYFEFMGDVGFGYMQAQEIDRSQAFGWEEFENANGIEGSVGAHVGWTACVNRHLLLGLRVGIAEHAANLHADFATGATYDERVRQTFVDGRFMIGYRF